MAQVEALERERAECAGAVARKEEELVDLLQERARDQAALADKDMAAQEQARRPPPLPGLARSTGLSSACGHLLPASAFGSTSNIPRKHSLKHHGETDIQATGIPGSACREGWGHLRCEIWHVLQNEAFEREKLARVAAEAERRAAADEARRAYAELQQAAARQLQQTLADASQREHQLRCGHINQAALQMGCITLR